MSTAAMSRQRITADLRVLGVAMGDVLMVHASLRAIGPTDGGADGVIEAIQAAIGPTGTLLMVLGARNDWAWVNERPEEERPALLADADPFDARSTPADPEVGTLAEVFRQRPETQVSDHPEGRFGAAGPRAGALLSDVPWDDYFGAGSPLERLVQANGRVLRLGADMNTTTLLHYAEYLVPLEPKRRVRRYRLVRTPAGTELRVVDTLDDNEGIVAYPADRDYFEDLLRDYLADGRAREGIVGAASSQLIDAADLVDFGVAWMLEHLARRRPSGSARESTARLRHRRDTAPAGSGGASSADPAELARFHDALARIPVRQGRFERLLRRAIRVGCRVFAFHVDILPTTDLPSEPGRRPGSGCLIVAAPHRAWIEPFLLMAAWPPDAARLVWLADDRTLTRSWWRRRVLPRVGVIPIRRTVGGPGAYAETAATLIAAGAALVVFPEKGPPSPPDRTRAISPGFAYLARRAGAPIIPVVIAGTHHIVRGSSFSVQFLDQIETGSADADPFARASRPKAHALADRYAEMVNATLPESNARTDARRPVRERWPWLARLVR